MIDPKLWIEHLNEPLVLVEFGFFVFATLAAVVVKQRSNVSANAKLAVKMLFALGVIITVGGFFIAVKKTERVLMNPPINVNRQNTEGDLSPAISAGKDVNVQYEASGQPQKPLNHTGATDNGALADSPAESNSTNSTDQKTTGYQSPAIQSGRDVNIQYGKSK